MRALFVGCLVLSVFVIGRKYTVFKRRGQHVVSLLYLTEGLGQLAFAVASFFSTVPDGMEYSADLLLVGESPIVRFFGFFALLNFHVLIDIVRLLLARKNIPYCRRPFFDVMTTIWMFANFTLFLHSSVAGVNTFYHFVWYSFFGCILVLLVSEFIQNGVSRLFLFQLAYFLQFFTFSVPAYQKETINTLLWGWY